MVSKVYTGRAKIMTSLEPTLDNIPTIINEALKVHRENAREIAALKKIYLGEHDILSRSKDVRGDINNKVVIDYALSTTRDIVGYTYGKPIEYVPRKDGSRDDIKVLNDFALTAHKDASDQIKATNCSIFGLGHRGVFPDKDLGVHDGVPYNYVDLDSENTFVVYSTAIGNPEVLACTYINEDRGVDGQETKYFVYTRDYEMVYLGKSLVNGIEAKDLLVMPKKNTLGRIPIIETENNQFRMGHWEAALTIYDAINLIASDSVNDVVQFVNSILVVLNAELDEETMQKVGKNKFMSLISPEKGITADAKYIAKQLDSHGVEALRRYLEEAFRIVVGVPDRKTRGGGGGDTGDAVELRDGWADIEIVARTTEMFFKKAETKELGLIVKILQDLNLISRDLTVVDVDIKMSRNKRDNLVSKVNAMAVMKSTEMFAPEDIVEIGGITNNVLEVVERGRKYKDEMLAKGEKQPNSGIELKNDGNTREDI